MRRALLLLTVVIAPLAFANHLVLFDRFGAYWAPVDGGPVWPVVENRVARSASDGSRVLIAHFAPDGLRAGVYDEGATTPVGESLLAANFDNAHAPVVIWDGSRYVVFWVANAIVRGAAIDANGAVVSQFTLPELSSISGAASNRNSIAVIRIFESATHAGNVEVLLLDDQFHVTKRTVVGSTIKSSGSGHTSLQLARVTAFGTGYYAAWQQERSSRYRDIIGTRITSAGVALDVVPSTREQASLMGTTLASIESDSNTLFDLELFVHRARVFAVMKRTWGREVTATAIDAAGKTEGPFHVGGKFNMPENAETIALANGTLALSWFELNRIATVQPFRALSSPGRRRAARH